MINWFSGARLPSFCLVLKAMVQCSTPHPSKMLETRFFDVSNHFEVKIKLFSSFFAFKKRSKEQFFWGRKMIFLKNFFQTNWKGDFEGFFSKFWATLEWLSKRKFEMTFGRILSEFWGNFVRILSKIQKENLERLLGEFCGNFDGISTQIWATLEEKNSSEFEENFGQIWATFRWLSIDFWTNFERTTLREFGANFKGSTLSVIWWTFERILKGDCEENFTGILSNFWETFHAHPSNFWTNFEGRIFRFEYFTFPDALFAPFYFVAVSAAFGSSNFGNLRQFWSHFGNDKAKNTKILSAAKQKFFFSSFLCLSVLLCLIFATLTHS